MSAEWPAVTIDQVCVLIVDCVNKTAPVADGPTPYRMIRTTNIRNGRIDRNECRYVDEATYAKWTRRADLRFGDVLLTREAPIGEVGFVIEPQGFFLGQRVMQYRANAAKLSPRFLLYSFLSPALQHQFGSHEGSGSVVSHIRVGDCFKFKLKLPPLPVQDEIASLLGALDDRIALLRETNATLEAIAQALFKSWFVDFDPVRAKQQGLAPAGVDEATATLFPDSFEESALGSVPKGWRVGTLGELADLNAKTWSGRSHPERVQYLDLANVKNNEVAAFMEFAFDDAPSRARRALRNSDTLVGTVRPGNRSFAFIHEPQPHLTASTGFAVLSPRAVDNTAFVYLGATQDASIEHLAHVADGGAYPAVRPDAVSGLVCTVPSAAVLRAFNAVACPLLEKVSANQRQARTLATLRDTLLPRLISGQLRLPEAEALAA